MINGFILAFQFFSRIPINKSIDFNEKNIRNSIYFIPLVGTVIGFISILFYNLLAPYNRLIGSFITLLVSIFLTGGLHLDGLSDTCDGFLSNRDKEKTFEIMKDSRIGAFGVLSIILQILFKFILIYSIDNISLAFILSFINSRIVLINIISYKKIAKNQGLGYLFYNSNPKIPTDISTIIYIILLMIINPYYLIPLFISIIFAHWISHISYKKIDGLTGDVYGMLIELIETISLFTFWILTLWF